MEDLVNKNYKEKYDKALEWAKELYNSNNANLNLKVTLKDIFPELKENEDENIRKAVKEAVEYYWSDDTQARTDILSWLEKQGEQKPIWSKEDYDEMGVIACHLDNMGNEAMAKSLLCIRDKYNVKSKPAWSEEDEEMYIQICNDIDYLSRFTDRCDINLFHKKTNWLESLKERMKGE